LTFQIDAQKQQRVASRTRDEVVAAFRAWRNHQRF
jgi:hypothetical protein